MRNSLRLSMAAGLLAALAACSGSSDQPTLSDDLKQDLAKAGGSDVQLAGNSGQKLVVVSASEQSMGNVPTPNARTVTKAPSANRGTRAVVKSARKATPAPAPVESPKAESPSPVEPTHTEIDPLKSPFPSSRPEAPRPSTQPEPRGGWKTPGQVIRNAPFPINP